jgi:hypothetical protein
MLKYHVGDLFIEVTYHDHLKIINVCSDVYQVLLSFKDGTRRATYYYESYLEQWYTRVR